MLFQSFPRALRITWHTFGSRGRLQATASCLELARHGPVEHAVHGLTAWEQNSEVALCPGIQPMGIQGLATFLEFPGCPRVISDAGHGLNAWERSSRISLCTGIQPGPAFRALDWIPAPASCLKFADNLFLTWILKLLFHKLVQISSYLVLHSKYLWPRCFFPVLVYIYLFL